MKRFGNIADIFSQLNFFVTSKSSVNFECWGLILNHCLPQIQVSGMLLKHRKKA